MASVKWTKTPVDAKSVSYTDEALKKHWEALHKGDHESFRKIASCRTRGAPFTPITSRKKRRPK